MLLMSDDSELNRIEEINFCHLNIQSITGKSSSSPLQNVIFGNPVDILFLTNLGSNRLTLMPSFLTLFILTEPRLDGFRGELPSFTNHLLASCRLFNTSQCLLSWTREIVIIVIIGQLGRPYSVVTQPVISPGSVHDYQLGVKDVLLLDYCHLI